MAIMKKGEERPVSLLNPWSRAVRHLSARDLETISAPGRFLEDR
jgi:hypothetical protein